MSKKCYFFQNSGIGDIFYLQKAAHFYANLGYEIIWPILPQLLFLKDYLQTPAKFSDVTEVFVDINDIALNFQVADRIFPECKIMEAKYKLVNIDGSDWLNYFNFTRNISKEELLYSLLNPNDEDYILVSRNYGTPPDYKKANFGVDTKYGKIIEVDLIEGFTIFDWCKLIENAKEIWMMDTSLNYIIDKLDLKAEKLKLFSRRPDFSEIDYLFKTKWEYSY